MQALEHMVNGEIDKARQILRDVPAADLRAELDALQGRLTTLSDAARYLEGNRAQRRAAARGSGRVKGEG